MMSFTRSWVSDGRSGAVSMDGDDVRLRNLPVIYTSDKGLRVNTLELTLFHSSEYRPTSLIVTRLGLLSWGEPSPRKILNV
jgi:hypothetical protein